jgi:hypothetical protein
MVTDTQKLLEPMITEVITQPEQVTAEWLTQVLKEQGYLNKGNVISLHEDRLI